MNELPRAVTYRTEDDWLDSRRQFIGASESPALMGEGYAGQTPMSIWASKVHGLDMEIDPKVRKRLIAGRIAESSSLRIAQAWTDIDIEAADCPTVIVHPEHDFIRCTLDGWTSDDRVVEAKFCTVPKIFDQWADEGLPDRFIIQVQHQLACTGWSRGMIVAVCPGNRDPIIQDVERHDEFIGKLVEYLRWWWDKFVIGRETPPMDGDEKTKKLLHKLYGSGVELTCQRLGNLDELVDSYEELGRKAREIEEERTRIGNQLRDAIGSCEYGVTSGGRTLSWKEVNRREFVMPASSSRQLRIVKALPRNVRFI